VNNIQCADDTVVFSDKMIEIYISKTKFMVINSRETGGRYGLMINNTSINILAQFTYMGTMIK